MGQKELKSVLFVFLLIILTVAMASFASGEVLINEFLADANDTNHEWIELYSNSSNTEVLLNYVITDATGVNFTLTNDFLFPNSYVILARNEGAFNATYNLGDITVIEYSGFILNDNTDSIYLYNSSGDLVDSFVDYATQEENVTIGRFPDGSSNIINLSVQTPGAANDNLPPSLNRWLNSLTNNSNVKGTVNITVNITDLIYAVNTSFFSYNSSNFSNFSMDNVNGNLWNFTWNTLQVNDGRYNLTIWFNDSVGLSGSDILYNITVDNTAPAIFSVNSANNSNLSGTYVINVTADDITTELTSLFYNVTN